MYATFSIGAKCRINDIYTRPTDEEVRDMLDRLLYENCGIIADLRVYGLEYHEEESDQDG